MRKEERVRLEMFKRVRNFGAANLELFPEGTAGGEAFAIVGQAVEAIEAHTVAKLSASSEVRKATARTRSAVREQMKAIALTARGLALVEDGIDKNFHMPTRHSDNALVGAAGKFLDEAKAQKAKFVRLGLPATFLDDLRTHVAALEKALEHRRAGRRGRKLAQGDVTTAFDRGTLAIRTLDVVVVNAVRGDLGRFESWKTMRRLDGMSKSSSRRVKVPAPVVAASAADETPPAVESPALVEAPTEPTDQLPKAS